MKFKVFSLVTILAFIFSMNAFSQRDNRTQSRGLYGQRFSQGSRFDNFFSNRNRITDSRRLGGNDSIAIERESFFTEEQKEKLSELQSNREDESKPLNDQLRELKARHITLTTADEPDMNAIYESIDKMSELEASLEKIQVKYQQEMRSILTEDQLNRFGKRGRMMTNRIFK